MNRCGAPLGVLVVLMTLLGAWLLAACDARERILDTVTPTTNTLGPLP